MKIFRKKAKQSTPEHFWAKHKPVKFSYSFLFPDGTEYSVDQLNHMHPEVALSIKKSYDKAWKDHRNQQRSKDAHAERRRLRRKLKRQAKKAKA